MDRHLAEQIMTDLQRHRFSLAQEHQTQEQLAEAFQSLGYKFQREYRLDERNRVDFFMDGLAIEVKLKGSRMEIYRQCERYCAHPDVKGLLLLTNRAMNLPTTIFKKPTFKFNLGKAWL